MSESKRGCGYRKIGGLYLVCDPSDFVVCDGLPMRLMACDCCGYYPKFSRSLQELKPSYVDEMSKKSHTLKGKTPCSCYAFCPICAADYTVTYGLMFVSKDYYTPASFIAEAETLGVSKRISEVPSWLTLGKSWILLAHNETPNVSLEEIKGEGLLSKEPTKSRQVFYAFKPSRVEMPVFKGELSQNEITALVEKGITPVFIDPTPENKKLHKRAANFWKRVKNALPLEEVEE